MRKKSEQENVFPILNNKISEVSPNDRFNHTLNERERRKSGFSMTPKNNYFEIVFSEKRCF